MLWSENWFDFDFGNPFVNSTYIDQNYVGRFWNRSEFQIIISQIQQNIV